MKWVGNYTEDYATLNFKFSTHQAAGAPITLAGTPAVSVYKANGTTQSTAGITLTVDFDGVTGLHNVLIDLSADAFYAVANDYAVVITTGTVDSVSVVGTVLAHFGIENRYMEADVTKIAGAAVSTTTAQLGVNAVQVGGAAPDDSAAIAAAVRDVSNAAPAASSLGAAVNTIDGIVDTIVARVIGTIATGTHNPQSGDAFARLGAPAGASVSADIAAIEAQTDDIGIAGAGLTALGDTRIANLDATVSSRLAPAGTLATVTTLTNLPAITANWLTAAGMDATAGAEIADAVWDEALAGHAGAGSAGLALSTASSGGVDPSVLADAIWDEALSGHATAGTAGKALSDVLVDTAEIGTAGAGLTALATAANLSTVAGYIDTEVASILAAVDTEVAGIVTTLGTAGAGLTALGDTRLANLDATVSSRLAPAGTLATVTAVTNPVSLTGDLTATMKTSVTTAATAATPTAAAVTGAVGSVTAGVTLAADAVSAAALSAAAIDEILDEQIGDGTITMRQALRVMLAAMAGKLTGAATTSVTIRNLADTADVIVAVVDADGNRSPAPTVTP